MVETTISRGGAEAAENCRAIGVSCARLLSAASAPPREAFFTGSACRRSSASRRFAPAEPPPGPSPERRRRYSSAISRRPRVQLPPICFFTGAGHYALKVENDGLTRRRG